MSLFSVVILRDVIAAQPTDNSILKTGRLFISTDTGVWYRDNGTTWDVVTPGNVLGLTNYAEEVVAFTGTAGTLTHTPILLSALEDNGKTLRKVGGTPEFSISGPNVTLNYAPGGTHVFVAKYWY